MGNVVKAVFGKNAKEIQTAPLFQYDYGQILIIEGITLPTAYQVHFSNEPYGTSTTSIGGADGVEIPDAYLQTGADVYAWLFLQTGENDGRTVAMIRIPVKARAEITNEEPTEVQQGEIDQLIAALNDAVEDAEDSAEDAEDAAEDAADSAEDAEAWAQGTRGGEPVGSTDPAYQKNAKYYSEQAAMNDAYVWIRYAAAQPTADADMKTTPDAWIGIYSGDAATEPEHYTDYTWYKIKGDPGNVQDVQVDGASIMGQGGIANIPKATGSNFGVMRVGSGLSIYNDKVITSPPTEAQIKAATSQNLPITPFRQHIAVFYGLAKLAGVDMAALTGETVGVYPDAQKIAIQKMLGIYEAPWELIREDTVTNATEADIEITVDGDGNAFELTDVAIALETPKQDTACGLGGSGNIRFYYGASDYIVAWVDGWTQAANANGNGTQSVVENKGGLIRITSMQKSTSEVSNVRTNWASGLTGYNMGLQLIQNFSVNKVVVRLLTGTAHYKLFGKRKWTT